MKGRGYRLYKCHPVDYRKLVVLSSFEQKKATTSFLINYSIYFVVSSIDVQFEPWSWETVARGKLAKLVIYVLLWYYDE